MLATACPHCGRPAPVHLGSRAIVCPACQTTSPVPTQVAQRLYAADGVLRQVQARRRQLSSRTRWLLLHSGLRFAFFATALGVLMVPFCCLAWIGIDIATVDELTVATPACFKNDAESWAVITAVAWAISLVTLGV